MKLFGFFSKNMTEFFNHYADWSRIGELYNTGTHRYSTKEIRDRIIIFACAATSGFLGSYFNKEEETKCSSLTVGIASAMLGFTVSHALIIAPLIMKRYHKSKTCDLLINTIQEKIVSNSVTYKQEINALIKQIMKISLSDENHGRASQTWGLRLRLLQNLEKNLQKDLKPILNEIKKYQSPHTEENLNDHTTNQLRRH